MYVDYGGRRYKQSDLPVANKNIASYLLAQNSVAEVFFRKKLSDPMCDFVHNKYVSVIAMSP